MLPRLLRKASLLIDAPNRFEIWQNEGRAGRAFESSYDRRILEIMSSSLREALASLTIDRRFAENPEAAVVISAHRESTARVYTSIADDARAAGNYRVTMVLSEQ